MLKQNPTNSTTQNGSLSKSTFVANVAEIINCKGHSFKHPVFQQLSDAKVCIQTWNILRDNTLSQNKCSPELTW